MSSLGKLRLAAHAALAVVAVAASPETAGASTTSGATPTIRLSPYSGPSTSTVRIAGDGFGARERVEIGLDGEKIGTTGTLSSGSLSPVAVRIPAGTQPGQKQVSAEGEESGRVARRAFVVRTDWSQMGFNARRTSFNPFEDTIGRANAGDLSSAWTRHDCLISWSYSGGAAPTVARGLVWVGAIDDICAFDARSGALRHKIETPWGAASSYSSPVAATVAGSHRLFVGAPSGLHAYSAPTGQLLGQLPTDGYADASPAIEGGVVYVGSEGGIVYAVDAQSGQVRWKRETGGPVESAVAVRRGKAYLASDGRLQAFDTDDGDRVFSKDIDGSLWNGSSPVAVWSASRSNGLVYVANGRSDGHTLHALDADTGERAWARSFSRTNRRPATPRSRSRTASSTTRPIADCTR